MNQDTIIVTGGAGFIGSAFVIKALEKGYFVVVLDKLTYSGNMQNLSDATNHPKFHFYQADICDSSFVEHVLQLHKPRAIINFAAESHVDNSISGPAPFIQTNIVGTFALLESARKYWHTTTMNENFRFLHVSTDEVYGSLGEHSPKFIEDSPYSPNSPYAASKASSDHLVRSWYETYKLPCIITNCSNNFGPRQHPEKLVPKTILAALNGFDIIVYGDGKNIRDWIYVEDHVDGIFLALNKGSPGEKYLFGGDNEIRNIDLVHMICNIISSKINFSPLEKVKFVTDRPGHDFRYAIDASKARNEIGFSNNTDFNKSLDITIEWYMNFERESTHSKYQVPY